MLDTEEIESTSVIMDADHVIAEQQEGSTDTSAYKTAPNGPILHADDQLHDYVRLDANVKRAVGSSFGDDLADDVPVLFRILDLVSERGSSGLFDKILIPEQSFGAFINRISFDACTSMTRVDFKALDDAYITPIGIYGSKTEIVVYLRAIEVISRAHAFMLLNPPEGKALRTGIYALCTSALENTHIIYWPEEGSWENDASPTLVRHRTTFMRHLTKISNQVVCLLPDEDSRSWVWDTTSGDTTSEVWDDKSDTMYSASEATESEDLEASVMVKPVFKNTSQNSLIDCHYDVWTEYPVAASVDRHAAGANTSNSCTLTFVTFNDHQRYQKYWRNLVTKFERSVRKPTRGKLSSLAVSAVTLKSFLEEEKKYSRYRAGEWFADVISLIPLHIAVARENRFVPLKDGIWSAEHERSLLGAKVEEIVDSITLGWYESLFKSYMASKPVKVVSSMGEKSVGKSFALNHLLDTSFAGSAMRTTEGVWMSVTATQQHLIVALDFEGMHNIGRSAQEDTLLVLFNTALSNLVLFRNNFALSRDLAGLFRSLKSSSNILDHAANPTLFQSTVVIIIKDVVDSDRRDITREFAHKFHEIVRLEQEEDFITRLHRGKLNIMPWPVIESEAFYTLFDELKDSLLKQPVTYPSARNFIRTMKMLMEALKANDWKFLSRGCFRAFPEATPHMMIENLASRRAHDLLSCLPYALGFGYEEVEPERQVLMDHDTHLPIPGFDSETRFHLTDVPGTNREEILFTIQASYERAIARDSAPEADWVASLEDHLDELTQSSPATG